MRKSFINYLLLSLLFCSNYGLAAVYTVASNNMYFSVNTSTYTAELTSVQSSTVYQDLIIPNTVSYNNTNYRVTSIRAQVFKDNKNLKGSLTIGRYVETIGNSAFYGCTGLNGTLTLGNSLTKIGTYAFYKCSGLKGSLNFTDKITSIGEGAFSYCSGFNGNLIIPNSVTTIGAGAFSDCTGFNGSLMISDSLTEIEGSIFYNCSGLKGALVIPDRINSIGESAFRSCIGLTGTLTLPDRITSIGPGAFQDCTGFSGSLIIPNSVKSVGIAAFKNCTGFNGTLTLSNSLTSILQETFDGCKGFTGNLIIPSSIQKILELAFARCSGFTSVTAEATTPPSCVFFNNNNVFTKYSIPLYVPSESVNKYKTAVEWQKFTIISPIPIFATDITLNKSNLSILVGQEETLIANLTPADATTEIIWDTKDNDGVISVDQSGKVTALSVGTAVVTATSGDVYASCNITVNPLLATSLTIDGNDIHTLKQTETLQLTATIIPDNTTYQGIIWTSSDESKATVSNSGLVTAIEEGEVEIIATLSYQPQVNTSYDITIQKRLLGDANDNGIVNVADVGTISDYIVDKPVYNFCFVNADVVTDGRITTADVTATVDIIFNDTPSMAIYAKARKISANGNNELIVDNFNSSASSLVDVNLKNPAEFTGLQGSIIIPEGVTIKNVTKGAGASNHILNYNFTDHGTIEFILYSLQNASFDNMGSLIEMEIQADRHSDDLIVENILASDSAANEYSLSFSGGKNNDFTTSLDTVDDANILIYSSSNGIVILNAQGENVNIFNIAGERIVTSDVRTNKEFYPLANGIYIVTVKSKTAKIIVK